MTVQECCEILEHVGIRPTSVRILVYEAINDMQNTFNLNDIEIVLERVDKSTIFRTLTLFSEHHLIHSVEDGSGSQKFCLCHNHGECREEESHCHFYCECCKKTYCLEEDIIPNVMLPAGFVVRKVNYLAKGICANCRKERKDVTHS